MATTAVTCPIQSNGTRRRGERSIRTASTIAASPTGTLMKKISRHVTSVSTPPSTGPHDDASAPPIAHTATARARRAGSG